jgi:SNF2 family DNA or RNA helicase
MPIITPLMEHQNQIVAFCKDKKYAAIFAEYGTGKTLCVLKLAELLNLRKILVVCSKTAILATWPSELSKHTDFHYTYLTGTKTQRIRSLLLGLRKSTMPEQYYAAEYSRPTFFLINFDGVKSVYNELVQADFDLIVVDESTKIKYPSTERTKVLWALAKNITRRYILTGFPITESPQDLYSQIKFLDRGATFGGSYYAFMDKYFAKIGYKRVIKKGATEEILDKIKGFCIRVTNESLKLPPKRYHKIDIDQTEEQKKYLKELKDYMQLAVGNVKIDTQYIFTLITKSLEICDGFVKDNEENYALVETNKDAILLDLLEEIDVQHHKVLIWSPFRFTISKLTKLLEHHGMPVLTLTGDTEDVKGTVDKFMISKTHNIMIMTEKKAAESLNLVNCNIAIYYSNEWSYDRRANSEARIYRKGSEKHESVIYIDFCTKGTIEEAVYNCLKKKKDLVDALKEFFGAVKKGE